MLTSAATKTGSHEEQSGLSGDRMNVANATAQFYRSQSAACYLVLEISCAGAGRVAFGGS